MCKFILRNESDAVGLKFSLGNRFLGLRAGPEEE